MQLHSSSAESIRLSQSSSMSLQISGRVAPVVEQVSATRLGAHTTIPPPHRPTPQLNLAPVS